MRLSLLAAPLAALVFVGCSSTKTTAPSPKAEASAAPQEKPPAQPSRETADPAPPPTADPALGAAGSPPTQPEGPATDTDTDKPPPDPYAGVRGKWVSYPEQIEEMLEPVLKDVLHAAYVPKLHEDTRKTIAVMRLGTYRIPPLPPETEKILRSLVAKAKDTEIAGRAYLVSADSLLGGKGSLLAAAYEQVIDEGTVVPQKTRDQLAEMLKWENPEEAFPRPQEELTGVITELAERVRTKLLTQSVWGNNIFDLAVPIEILGKSVIQKRRLSRTFHDLLMALPEPHRSNILMRVAWSPMQEAELDEVRDKLKHGTASGQNPKYIAMNPEARPQFEAKYTEELEAFAAVRREKFLQLEQARRETIEGFFTDLDARGSAALVAINERLTNLQAVLDHIVGDLDKLGDGFDVQLMSWGDGSGAPTSGENLFVVGTDNNGLLHIRIFDAAGTRIKDTDETQRPAQAAAIATLKRQLPGLLSPHVLTDAEKAQVIAEATSIIDQTLGYRFKPLVPAEAVQAAGANILSRIPLPGSVKDRVPTISIRDLEIVFDAPAGQPSYADLIKPGNVLIGTLSLQEVPLQEQVTTSEAELHIAAIGRSKVERRNPYTGRTDELDAVEGEVVVKLADGRKLSVPLNGWLIPSGGFSFEAHGTVEGEYIDLGTFTGSLDKGGALTGIVRTDTQQQRAVFSFSLKK